MIMDQRFFVFNFVILPINFLICIIGWRGQGFIDISFGAKYYLLVFQIILIIFLAFTFTKIYQTMKQNYEEELEKVRKNFIFFFITMQFTLTYKVAVNLDFYYFDQLDWTITLEELSQFCST